MPPSLISCRSCKLPSSDNICGHVIQVSVPGRTSIVLYSVPQRDAKHPGIKSSSVAKVSHQNAINQVMNSPSIPFPATTSYTAQCLLMAGSQPSRSTATSGYYSPPRTDTPLVAASIAEPSHPIHSDPS